jgi:enterochelin esterase-like enzyme
VALTAAAVVFAVLIGQSVQAGPELSPAAVAETAPAAAARLETHKLASASLGREMSYMVYLPPGYDSPQMARYPVLYMLHGLGGDYRSWERNGLFDAATAMIERGEIDPMIIVTPEGERGYWVDQANGGPRFGSYIARDLVATIDRDYRTLPNRLMRAIGGMSMGGHGALQLALNNPNQFGIVGAHSVALRRYEQAFAFFGDKQYFDAHDPVSLCAKNPTRARTFSIWVDIGNSDGWYQQAEAFHKLLAGAGVSHQWTVFNGGHDDAYWTAHVRDYLRFYSQAFDGDTNLAAAPRG